LTFRESLRDITSVRLSLRSPLITSLLSERWVAFADFSI